MKKLSILLISLTILIYSCSSNDDDTSPPPSVVQTPEPTTPTQYTLTVTSGEGGTVSTQGGTYDEGTEVTITATPDEGYVFTGWSDGSTNNSISIEVNQNTTLTASFVPDYQVINIGENKLFIDKTNIPDGDNFKLITQVVTSTGNIKLYFENVLDWVNNPVSSQTKLIKWSGTNDSLKNPILVEPNNQIIKPIVGNLYNYLDEEYDIPFIYSWSKQMHFTHNKPMGWEGNFLDYEGDGTPDLFALRNNNDGSKDFVVVGYNPFNRKYWIKKEINLIESLNFDPIDSLNTGTSIVGDFNNDNTLDFFGNAHGEWGVEGGNTSSNIFFQGPMFVSISDGMGNYSSTIIDEEKYLRFPGSLKTVDWNMDGNLDVFASMPYAIYLNNGDNTFTKIDISESIQPQLEWSSIAFDDLNNDGIVDIVGANFNMQITHGFGMEIYYGNPDGSFEYETVYHPLYNQLWNGSDDLTIIDVDGDGFKEILTYNMIELHIDLGRDYDVSEMREFKSTGNGYSLNTESNYNLTIRHRGASNSTTAWDYDGDGDLDIFLQSDDDTRTLSVHELFDEIPMGSLYNQFLKMEYITAEDFNNCNSYITGFFFENDNGSLVKRYFNELYSD